MHTINTGLCAFGMSGKVFHAPFLTVMPGFKFHAVYERSKRLAEEIYPDVITYHSLDELLADDSIELIVVNSPSFTHYDYAKQALTAGKHVIVEKPFTATTAEAQELVDLATECGKKLMVYQNRRWDSDFKTLTNVVKQGLLGNIVEAEFHFDRFKDEISPKAHKETPGPGAGILYDLGSHIIDQALHLFGMPDALYADIAIQRPVSAVADYFEILLFYPNLRVRLKAGYQVRELLPSYILHGSKGSYIKSRGDIQETVLTEGVLPVGDDWGTEPESEKGILHTEVDGNVIRQQINTEQGDYRTYYQLVYDAIINNTPMPVSATEGLHVIKIIEAAYQSSEQKKVLSLK